MTLTFSSPRNLTESLCQKDESIPLIEEPIGTALLRAADRYGQQIALVDGPGRDPTRNHVAGDHVTPQYEGTRTARSHARKYEKSGRQFEGAGLVCLNSRYSWGAT
jgi:hypothetical protein